MRKKVYKNSSSHSLPQSSQKRWKLALPILGLVVLMGLGVNFVRKGAIQGVPVTVMLKFLADAPARDAFFSGQKQVLHDRLSDLGIEEDVKAYYRPDFQDEQELDWFIHQIFYDRTGYIGRAYKVGKNQRLIPKKPPDYRYQDWLRLALELGLVTDEREEDGHYFVKTQEGAWISYYQIFEVYPIPSLRRMKRQRRQREKRRQLRSLGTSDGRAWGRRL